MSIITVGNTAALNSALSSVHDGDTILLNAGTYTGLTYSFNNLHFTNGITIASADPTHEAALTSFVMANSSGVTFSNVEMVTQKTGYFDFQVYASSNVHFDHVSVHGSMDGNPQNDIEGISVLKSTNVSITNSEFQQLERAMTFGSTNNVTIANNNVHDVEITGVSLAQVGSVHINGNTFSNFKPVVGIDHPDAIQFLTSGTTASSHDISITNNVISRGAGGATQGIFMRDLVGTLPYVNVNIANNLIDGTGYGGIAVDHAQNISVTGNNLVSLNGPTDTTPLQIFNSSGVTITGNQAVNFGTDGDTGLVMNGNVINAVVADGGAAALNAWMAAHPGSASLPPVVINPAPPPVPTPPPPITPPIASTPAGIVLTGDGFNNALVGTAGNDTLDGQGGSDTLSGGAGDDTYIVPNSQAVVVEGANGGNDTVIAKGTYTLGANLENLVINNSVANSWAGYGNALNNQITGNGGDNYLDGAAGNDTLNGGAGNDTLFGGLGDDRLTGGTGADTFRFAPGGGHDVITDYGNGADRIDISAYQKAGLTPTLHDVGSDVVISFTDGDTITVQGHHAADMHIWTYGWSV